MRNYFKDLLVEWHKFRNIKIRITKASCADCQILSHIAYSSTQYLDYPEEYLLRWKEGLTICTIKSVRVEKGFWLDHFFIKPEYIGFYFGKMLFSDCLLYCRKHDISEMMVFADPNPI